MLDRRYPCPCCGHATLAQPPPGTYALCPVCYWEDDGVQFADPTYEGGANLESLLEARRNYRKFGASSIAALPHVRPDDPEAPARNNEWVEILATRGISLRALGLDEVGLLRDDALRAVELVRASAVPILGGDVYFLEGETVEPALANWHTDRLPGEARSEFAERSCRRAMEYIESFPRRDDALPVFVLVLAPSGE